MGWAVPRLVKSLQFHPEDSLPPPFPYHSSTTSTPSVSSLDRVMQLSGGDMHTTVLYESGRMYLCGNGPVVTPIQLKEEEEEEGDDDDGVIPETKAEIEKAIKKLEQKLVTVTTPRCPSSLWYEKLSVRKIKYVSSSGTLSISLTPLSYLRVTKGTYSIVVQDEDMIVSSLTKTLLQHATNNPKVSLTGSLLAEGDNGTISTAETPPTSTLHFIQPHL
jgi:hypothetical protein